MALYSSGDLSGRFYLSDKRLKLQLGSTEARSKKPIARLYFLSHAAHFQKSDGDT